MIAAAAWLWLRRASGVEIVGAACVTYAAALVFVPLAWLVAGVALLLKAVEIDRRGNR